MVIIKLIELTEDRVTYEYYPEGNKQYPGKIALDLKTKERIYLKESSEDFSEKDMHFMLLRK